MSVHSFDPLRDPRWEAFVRGHPGSSIFHSIGWIDALCRTYGYRPVVYTTSPPEATLTNGIVLCRVESWLTGRRMVSLPFTDHCDPLVSLSEDQSELLRGLQSVAEAERLKYVEIRPRDSDPWDGGGLNASASYSFHMLDLRPSLDDLFKNTHKDTIQRKIRRAEREGLSCSEGTSDTLLNAFYGLLVLTRRRHGLPPQPRQWFRNLITCLGDQLRIRVAFNGGIPIGSILTLRNRDTLTYKYGCSDSRFHNLGTMPFLFWKAIADAKNSGADAFDLGRSDLENTGLITFKGRWGTVPSTLTYHRLKWRGHPEETRGLRIPDQLLAALPDRLLAAIGGRLYRHLG